MRPTVLLAVILQLANVWTRVPTQIQTRLAATAQPSTTIYQSSVAVPVASVSPSSINLEAGTSAYAVDVASGQVLYALNDSKPRPIASVTKLMTVMVALSQLKPDAVVKVGQLPDYDTADETMGLKTGEELHVIDLVKAALIPSDNDAADALAIATSGSLTKFYAAMNAKAAQWGITGAHFASATGLDDQNNLVSAQALSKIAMLDLANPALAKIFDTSRDTITDTAGRTFNLSTTDDLLATGQFYGIKTGYTEAAGECFVGLTKIDGHQIVTVVLGSSDRFGETGTLVNWIGHNWTWQ